MTESFCFQLQNQPAVFFSAKPRAVKKNKSEEASEKLKMWKSVGRGSGEEDVCHQFWMEGRSHDPRNRKGEKKKNTDRGGR